MSDENNPYAGSSAAGYSSGGTMRANVAAGAQQAPAPTAKPLLDDGVVKDVTTQSFMADVMEASKHGPVVVDFWAPWCGPCKQLGPIIEKVAAATKGVTLCKMDIEKYPEVSQQMGIQSIPAVVAFIDGRPDDAFMGAKGQSEVQAFFDKLAAKVPADTDSGMVEAMEEADGLMASGDHAGAAELYAAILAHEPGNLDAFAGLGQCYVAIGEFEMAQKLVDKVPEEHRESIPLVALIKAIDLAQQAADLGDIGGLAAAVEADPKNHQARFDYAVALNGNGKREEAADQLVAIVRVDRKWEDDGARAKLLEFFEVWGNADPATLSGRRALSSVLFS